ncbi:MAG: chemotaxis protein CheW [Sphingosinicella sp.]
MAELLLLARIAGQRVALPASEIEAVVELDALTPAPGAAPHVAGLTALRSRVLTVIDAPVALGLVTVARAVREALVVPSGGHPYALLVEAVDDVVESEGPPQHLRAPVGPGWERVALGMVEAGGELLLLIDPHALIAGPPAERAA